MRFSFSSRKKSCNVVRRALVIIITAAMLAPLSPAQAEIAKEMVRASLDSAIEIFRSKPSLNADGKAAQDYETQLELSPADRTARVARLRVCPRHLSLYPGEVFSLSALPLGRDDEIVQGARLSWEGSDPEVIEDATQSRKL